MSIVKLKNSEDKIMIVGYSAVEYHDGMEIYDYMGCSYPMGLLLNNNMCFGTMIRSIFLTKKGQKAKIIFPSKYFCDYSIHCFDDYKHTYYDKSKNILYLQTASFKIKTKYWDLSNIVTVFKKQGRVKNL